MGQGTECHQIIVEDWAKMEEPYGTLFLNMPSLLDPSVASPGTHVLHAFTPDWVDAWTVGFRVLHGPVRDSVRSALLLLVLLPVQPALVHACPERQRPTGLSHWRRICCGLTACRCLGETAHTS